MWQSLVDELKDEAFTLVAVALDHAEAARPWVEAARPDYPCLIDENHQVAALYGFVNVPQAVWIDEAGTVVRPPESAGASDAFRHMNRQTGALPEALMAERLQTRQRYLDAVKDWVRRGPASAHALPAATAVERWPLPDAAEAEAHARFRLGQALRRQGREAQAQAQWARAAELHPSSWAIWRQAAPKNERGLAAGPAFWARVDALGDRPYYPPAQLGA